MSLAPSAASTVRLDVHAAGIAAAAEILRRGGIVAFPTETVYGLGADATNGQAVAKIYAAKGRPSFNPLIAHTADTESAIRLGTFDGNALKLARAFWPGPLTLVVPAAPDCPVSDLARAGLPSVALRVPAHPVARAVLAASGRAICAPSANRSGHISATTAVHVLSDLDGRIDAVIDGGATAVGVESTIIACLDDTPRLLRAGGLTRAAIEEALGQTLANPAATPAGKAVIAPGMLTSHYAPQTRMRLNATEVLPGEAALLFGPPLPGTDRAVAVFNLSPQGHLEEAASNLFAAMRVLDASAAHCIAVAPIPQSGLGEAITDRLARAAVRE